MSSGNVHIERYVPESGTFETQSYDVPMGKGTTVLQALLYIYEEYDSTLAFRFGCRCVKCGECALNVDGIPRLACATSAHEQMRISPLKNLPPLRDLIVDRSVLDSRISELKLFVWPTVKQTLGPLPISQTYKHLIGCLECYGCVSSCPHFRWQDESFGGPYVFVRLAQLHLDPRDEMDRLAQAVSLGIEKCENCNQCRCVKGIPIRHDAIETLLRNRSTSECGNVATT